LLPLNTTERFGLLLRYGFIVFVNQYFHHVYVCQGREQEGWIAILS